MPIEKGEIMANFFSNFLWPLKGKTMPNFFLEPSGVPIFLPIEKGEIMANFFFELPMAFEGQNYAQFFPGALGSPHFQGQA